MRQGPLLTFRDSHVLLDDTEALARRVGWGSTGSMSASAYVLMRGAGSTSIESGVVVLSWRGSRR
jgi:hypothetical protein